VCVCVCVCVCASCVCFVCYVCFVCVLILCEHETESQCEDYDVYYRDCNVEPITPPCGGCKHLPLPTFNCPTEVVDLDLPNCEDTADVTGNRCESDLECATADINNCAPYEIYVKHCDICMDLCVAVPIPGMWHDGGGLCPDITTSEYESMANCDDAPSVTGTLCEADGECGTDTDTDNCGDFDLYMKLCGDDTLNYCNGCVLYPVPADACPADGNYDLATCDSSSTSGFCEGDGECSTSNDLNSCEDYDVYYRACS